MADKEPTDLPPEVERALARARRATEPAKPKKSGNWLAIVPVLVGAIALLFLFPRATPPDALPIPRVDHRVTDHIAAIEDELAASAVTNRPHGDVLAIGSAVRDLNVAEEKSEDEGQLLESRRRVETLVVRTMQLPHAAQELVLLRATQTRIFLDAVAKWERGEEPNDFIECGGGFVKHAMEAGWVEGRHVLLDETQRRVAFKTVWNAQTHVIGPSFALTLDEERALYAFYIEHPRVPETNRVGIQGKRRAATTAADCASAQGEEERLKELWRADKIKKLGALDPKYPAQYALGIAYTRANRPDLAVDSFTAFLDQHPDGPYALRAKNHLKSALVGAAP